MSQFSQHGRAALGEGGFTLIEVMFAVIYLAVGLLGVAAMQDIAISRNVDARRLTVATNLVTEMLERIRFNSPASATPIVPPPGGGVRPYPYNGNINCDHKTCVLTNLPGGANATALGDFSQWRARLTATDSAGAPLLPNVVGTLSSVEVGWPTPVSIALGQVQVAITVQWASAKDIFAHSITMTTIVAPP